MKKEATKELINKIFGKRAFLRCVVEQYLVKCRNDLLFRTYPNPLSVYIDFPKDGELKLEQVGENVNPEGKSFITLRLSGEFEQKEVSEFLHEDHSKEEIYHAPIHDPEDGSLLIPEWLEWPRVAFNAPVDVSDQRYVLFARYPGKEVLGRNSFEILLNAAFIEEDSSIQFGDIYIPDSEKSGECLLDERGCPVYICHVGEILKDPTDSGYTETLHANEERMKYMQENALKG